MNELWHNVDVEDGDTVHRRFGPISIALSRDAYEWRLVAEEAEPDSPAAYNGPLRLPRAFEPVRLAAGRTSHELRFTPALADRGIVARPEAPIYILANESVELFVSTPVWVQLRAGERSVVLHELPTVELAETWFGEVGGEGELCYASRTGARTNLEPYLLQATRALTIVELTNRSREHLLLERLKLPVPFLSISMGAEGALWTERLEMLTDADGEIVDVQLGEGAPPQAGETTQVAEPRRPVPRRSFVRAIGRLLR